MSEPFDDWWENTDDETRSLPVRDLCRVAFEAEVVFQSETFNEVVDTPRFPFRTT